MGVRGLETFVENNCPKAFFKVNIGKLSKWAKRRNKEVAPTILIDLNACGKYLYGNLDSLCGGQGALYLDRLESVIKAFNSAGIRLIFIHDGSTIKDKAATSASRKYSTAKRVVFKAFDSLKAGSYPQMSDFVCPNLLSSVILKDFFEQEVLSSEIGKDADQFIAELACNETLNVFGILSQDSDFLIYQYHKRVHYLSAKHLNFEGFKAKPPVLETYEYDRIGLAFCLNLKTAQLPLFAVLKGNDLIMCSELRGFHNWLAGNGDSQSIIGSEDLAAVIGIYFLDSPSECSKKVDDNWTRIVSIFPENEQIQKLLLGFPYRTTVHYEDYRNISIPTLATAYSRFRSRLYGVLFYEKFGPALMDPNNHFTFPELCMNGIGSLDKEVFQRIEPPPDFHPGLQELFKGNNCDVKWKIFGHIISPDLDCEILKIASEEGFLYPVCKINILQHDLDKPVLYGWEVKAFLIQHLRYKNMSEQQKRDIKRSCVPTERGIQLATLYTNGGLLNASGLVPEIIRPLQLAPILMFDGFHFQNVYHECGKDKKSTHRLVTSSEVEMLEKYFLWTTSNGKQVKENF